MRGYDRIFIGGRGQASKSTLSRKLAEATGYRHINLDTDYWIRKTMRLRFPSHRETARRLRAQYLVHHIPARTIIEGYQVQPDFIAKQLIRQPTLLAAFIGYPTCDEDKKVEHIHKSGVRKDLIKKPVDQLKNDIRRWKKRSLRLKNECQAHNVSFLDFSDLDNLDQLQTDAVRWITSNLSVAD